MTTSIVIPMEDPITHTAENGFECNDPDCICHWERRTQEQDCRCYWCSSESLGNERAVELDPATGGITILDEAHGVTLSAAQVLILTGFLSQHDAILIRAALALLDEMEM